MNSKEFRAELVKIMPGYEWTVHRPVSKTSTTLVATGTQHSGSNRISTLEVTRREAGGVVAYEARSSGYGTRAPWLHETMACTLARALRYLQEHYERTSATYRSHAAALQTGRAAIAKATGDTE